MANRFPAFQFYPKEWLSSTARRKMSLEAQGAYMNLLSHYWEGSCKGLPTDYRVLARLGEINGGEDQENAIISQIISSSFIEKKGVLHNKRLRRVYLDLVKFSTRASKAGRQGAQKRWGGHDSANAKGMADDSSPDSGLRTPVSGLQSEDLKYSGTPSVKSGSKEALIAAEYVRLNPGIIGQDKATAIVGFYLARGVDAMRAQEAVNDQANKGQFVWEIMNELSPAKVRKAKGDVHDEVKRILSGKAVAV